MTEINDFLQYFIKPQLSIAECRQILSRNGEQYSDEDIKAIIELIQHLVGIDLYYFHQEQRSKNADARIISIEPQNEINKNAA